MAGGELESIEHLLLLELVGAEDFEALKGLLGGEASRTASQVIKHLLQRYIFLHKSTATIKKLLQKEEIETRENKAVEE